MSESLRAELDAVENYEREQQKHRAENLRWIAEKLEEAFNQ
jgi:hypothetical protein